MNLELAGPSPKTKFFAVCFRGQPSNTDIASRKASKVSAPLAAEYADLVVSLRETSSTGIFEFDAVSADTIGIDSAFLFSAAACEMKRSIGCSSSASSMPLSRYHFRSWVALYSSAM